LKETTPEFWNKFDHSAAKRATLPFPVTSKAFFAFVFTPSCFRKAKMFRVIEKGAERFEFSTDILQMLRIQSRVLVLERLLLSTKLKSLLDNQQVSAVKTDSEVSEDEKEGHAVMDGSIVTDQFEKKLWIGVFSTKYLCDDFVKRN
jgi:hypothetical protein